MTRNANQNCLSAFLGATLILMLPAIVFAPLNVASAQTLSVLYDFDGASGGGNPVAGLVRYRDRERERPRNCPQSWRGPDHHRRTQNGHDSLPLAI